MARPGFELNFQIRPEVAAPLAQQHRNSGIPAGPLDLSFDPGFLSL
jgi:hypothetical protein